VPRLPRLQLEKLRARKRYTHPLPADVHEYGAQAVHFESAAKTERAGHYHIMRPSISADSRRNADIKATSLQVASSGTCSAGAGPAR